MVGWCAVLGCFCGLVRRRRYELVDVMFIDMTLINIIFYIQLCADVVSESLVLC